MATVTPSLLLMNSCWVLVIYLSLTCVPVEAQENLNCWYTNWAQYRPEPATYTVSDINPNLCTHATYAFAKLEGLNIVPYEANDDQPDGGMWKQFNDLKMINPDLKTFLSIGGYTLGPEPFSAMAATKENRTMFINNVVTHLRYWKFDGVDIDWEYVSAEDKQNYAFLVQEMFAAFEAEGAQTGRERLMLSLSVPAGIPIIDAGYDIPILDSNVDFFNVMTYDYHGSWENQTGFATPLFGQLGDLLNVNDTLTHYLEMGASQEKLFMGLAAYGRSWTLANSSQTLINSPATGPGEAGNYTRTEGILSYYEVCENLQNGYTQDRIDPAARVFFAHMDDQWMTYEIPLSLRFKVDQITRSYGGASFWAMDYDDFSGEFCGQGRYPLLSEVAFRLLGITTMAPTTPPTTAQMTTTPLTTTPVLTTAPTTTMQTTMMMTTTASGTYSCPESMVLYPDPYSCEFYIMCLFDQPYRVPCPDGYIYNADMEQCEPSASSTYTCMIVTTTTVTTPTQNYPCVEDYGDFPSKDNCSDYFTCFAGQPFAASCAENEIFNPNTSMCEDMATTSYTCPMK